MGTLKRTDEQKERTRARITTLQARQVTEQSIADLSPARAALVRMGKTGLASEMGVLLTELKDDLAKLEAHFTDLQAQHDAEREGTND